MATELLQTEPVPDFYDQVRDDQQHVVKGPRCTMCTALDSMTPELRAQVERALADRSISVPVIVKRLRARSVPINDFPVRRHREGGCAAGSRM